MGRALLGLMIVGVVALGPRHGLGAPPARCGVVDVPIASLDAALARLARPQPSPLPLPPTRWRALLPARMVLTGRDGVRAGVGWTTEPGSERLTQVAERGIGLRLDWDFRPLWEAPPALLRPDDRLRRAEDVEQLASRLAQGLRLLRKAQAQAALLPAGDPLCHEAQGEAEAAALVLRAVLEAAR